MAIESIGSSSGSVTTQRAQAAAQTSGLRNNPAVLNAIVQTQQKSSNATSIVKAFAVPQTSKSGGSSNVKLPRGSLVDVLT
jgi:hypothetical protein